MGRNPVVLLITVLLLFSSLAGLSSHDGEDEKVGPGPLNGSDIWSDSFDDLSNVYVPGTGLIGTEVIDGEVHLRAGRNHGWIASSVISVEPGYRYDFVLLDAETPGDSTVQISILDASEEASEAGYANETIEDHVKVNGTYLSVGSIDPLDFPEIRIQVNLDADGDDRPVLRAWSIFFIDSEEWHDDLIGPWKLSEIDGLNITDGLAEINQTRSRPTSSEPEVERRFPTIAICHGGNSDVFLFDPNTNLTDYEDYVALGLGGGAQAVAFDDFDCDGDLDVVATRGANLVIRYRDEFGQWNQTGAVTLTMPSGGSNFVTTGDFNGDGSPDIGASTYGSKPAVFLNKGNGSFNVTSDVVFTGVNAYDCIAGDLNGDGIDDFVTGGNIFFGGAGTFDGTADITLPGVSAWSSRLADIDGDGHLDVLVANGPGNGDPSIWMGGSNGPDTTLDYKLSTATESYRIGAGDVNGDGYQDIVSISSNPFDVEIFEGSASGWSSSSKHQVTTASQQCFGLVVYDVDQDGFDDIIIQSGGLKIFFGGVTWPTSPDITKSISARCYNIALVIGGGGYVRSSAHFVTEEIVLPAGKKWDLLDVKASIPINTSVTLSILDGNDHRVLGYEHITDSLIDLSGIDHRIIKTIKVRVQMRTLSPDVTPSVDLLRVRWMEAMSWREQFYSDLKIERLLGFGVQDERLDPTPSIWHTPQLLFSSLRDDLGYNTDSHAFVDLGGMEFLSLPSLDLQTSGAMGMDVSDVNGDGYLDIAFATHRTSGGNFYTSSPLFHGSAEGFDGQPQHVFPTVGARDVLLEDLNGDGHVDAVFAQEQDNGNFLINSTLFWGSASGWSSTPDIEFVTTGASDVEAADIDGDGNLDLVFACFRSEQTPERSLVFLQGSDGYDGSSADITLPTKGARAVAVADVDGDSNLDLVFANSLAVGVAEITSYIYWGEGDGDFAADPTELPTMGAQDVKVADLDGDGHLDIAFANGMDNNGEREIDSYVYLNDGTGSFGTSPDHLLPTRGASGVDVCDLDGTGWMDLVFACCENKTTCSVPSVVYLGGGSGWSSTPDIEIPTVGASDVVVEHLLRTGVGGYVSEAITPNPFDDPGTYHTFRSSVVLGASQSGKVQLIDAVTGEVLGGNDLVDGPNEWVVAGLFRYKDHPSVRLRITCEGLEKPGACVIDDLSLNWTERAQLPPEVISLSVGQPSVMRTQKTTVSVEVSDEYDFPNELTVFLDCSRSGTEEWSSSLLRSRTFEDGLWTFEFSPKANTAVGPYDFRVMVRDLDMLSSDDVIFPDLVQVVNNVPTLPRISIVPAIPDTTQTLRVEILQGSHDVEGMALTYRFSWYLDGVQQPPLASDYVDAALTAKGQNWSVEVRAFDGEDEGPAATAWRVIQNAAPRTGLDLPDPVFPEDTVDTEWLDLSMAFKDPDDDVLTWTVETPPLHIVVEIDPNTGRVTLTPEENWNGHETITFVSSDGEGTTSQTVDVHVTGVNDIPRFATVNGKPVGDGPVAMTVEQNGLLSIEVLVIDPENDLLVFYINTTLFEVDSTTGSISWHPTNDDVGEVRFGLTMWDVASPSEKVTLDFIITVENVNDPMGDPIITMPGPGASYWEGTSFFLKAYCSDPDLQHGQELNFTWSSNMTGPLGYGSNLDVSLSGLGIHVITLTVTDGEFQKMTTVDVLITAEPAGPPLPPTNGGEDEEEPFNYVPVLGLVIALVIIGVVLFVARSRKKTDELEDVGPETATEQVEAEWVETEGETEEQSPGPEGIPMEVRGEELPEGYLSMQTQATEAPSAETMTLFGAAAAAEPVMSEQEQEQLRLDNLKRKYQNAIGRLPYGIPSPELEDRDWVDLANALATGEKRETPGGRELTMIDGTWYYSDVKDTGTFLKAHGERPKPKVEEQKEKETAVAITDKAALLAKLEERFILGEISEEAYHRLTKKYEE